ncbi:kinesin, motor domain-containing protein [Tanacetum coccineum]
MGRTKDMVLKKMAVDDIISNDTKINRSWFDIDAAKVGLIEKIDRLSTLTKPLFVFLYGVGLLCGTIEHFISMHAPPKDFHSALYEFIVSIAFAVEGQVKESYLKIGFSERAKERKELYNKIRKLKGNIRVFCRCRPLNSEEIADGASVAFDFEGSKDGELKVKSNVAFKKNFKFDPVFSLKQPKAMFLRIHPHLQHRFLMDVTHAYLLMDKLEPERLLQWREQMKTEVIEKSEKHITTSAGQDLIRSVLCPVPHEKGVDVCLALLQRISDLKEASQIVVLLPDIA